MGCMKCGRETVNEQAFCPECQQDMAKYPVRPGTIVLLPRRVEHTVIKKQPKKRILPPEEQVIILNRRVRGLFLALLVVLGIAIALAVPAYQHLTEDRFKIGQNYTTVTVPQETN